MGARLSRRSVDITTTPKKGEDGETIAQSPPTEGEGKLGQLDDPDRLKANLTNGDAHIEKEKDNESPVDQPTEPITNGTSDSEDVKTPDTDKSIAEQNGDTGDAKPLTNGDSAEQQAAAGDEKNDADEAPKKKKAGKIKTWLINKRESFSKRDKQKPSVEKNGVPEPVKESTEETTTTPTTAEEQTPQEQPPTAAESPKEAATTNEEASEAVSVPLAASSPVKEMETKLESLAVSNDAAPAKEDVVEVVAAPPAAAAAPVVAITETPAPIEEAPAEEKANISDAAPAKDLSSTVEPTDSPVCEVDDVATSNAVDCSTVDTTSTTDD